MYILMYVHTYVLLASSADKVQLFQLFPARLRWLFQFEVLQQRIDMANLFGQFSILTNCWTRISKVHRYKKLFEIIYDLISFKSSFFMYLHTYVRTYIFISSCVASNDICFSKFWINCLWMKGDSRQQPLWTHAVIKCTFF